MGTVHTFRLPGGEARRQQPDRRVPVIQIDSRRSMIHPAYQIKVPVLRQPVLYDQANELDE